MKRRTGRLGDWVATLLLLVIGGGLIYGGLFNVEVGRKIAEALKMPLVGAGVGAILVLSVLLRWVGGCCRKKERFINFQSDDGEVGISTKAIKDFIERAGKEFSAVKSIDTRLVEEKNALDIELQVKVVSGNRIPELSQVLQRRIRERVRESLGLEEIRNITIHVQEIIGEPAQVENEEAFDKE